MTTKTKVERRKAVKWSKGSKRREAREGSNRAEVVRLMSLKNGTTFAAIQAATGWDYKTSYDAVRLVAKTLGYSVVERNGRLFAS